MEKMGDEKERFSGREMSRNTHELNTNHPHIVYREALSYFVSSRVKSFGEKEK